LKAWQPNVHENDFWCLPRGSARMPSFTVENLTIKTQMKAAMGFGDRNILSI